MQKVEDILFWKKQLGCLPIHLSPSVDDKYIMLNGVNGNFCLHFSDRGEESQVYFSESWSSNTKNFLLVDDKNVRLFNWYENAKVEVIAARTVEDNIEKFYQYLLSKSFKSEKDVVPFIIDIFRQLRNSTREKKNQVEALNLLFALLISVEEGRHDHKEEKKWGIDFASIPTQFDQYADKLKSGLERISPNLDLVLRHCAGSLFQEAQKEVLFFDNQIDLFGSFSSELITKQLAYSSIHYTPSFLARSIVESTLRLIDLDKLPEIRILDPACGSAEFLVEILKQLKERKYQGAIRILGFDTSETAVNTSNFLLNYEKLSSWHDNLTYSIKRVEDSLVEEWGKDHHIILMNPPFVSWEQLDEKSKREAVRETLGSNFKGHPNQASAFFYKAVKHLFDGGALGCVMPTSLFSAEAYQKLRIEVEETMSLQLVGKLGNFVFEEALTDVSIVVGKKGFLNSPPTLLWTKNEKGVVYKALRELRKIQYSEGYTKESIDFSIFKPQRFPVIADNWKPLSAKEYKLINELTVYARIGKLSPISDIFDVQQGVRTGNNDIFKISPYAYKRLPDSEREYFRPAVENDSISSGVLSITSYVWYPYGEKGLLLQTEEEFSEKVPKFYSEVVKYKDALAKRARKDEEDWWTLSEHRAWQRTASPRLVSTEFGNSASFAVDPKGSFVVERGHAWQPKKKFVKDDYYFYLALFSSPFFDKLLSIYSKELAGGRWYDLGKKGTKHIFIPDVNSSEVTKGEAYRRMVDVGRKLSEGDSYVRILIGDIIEAFYPVHSLQ